MFGNRIFYVQLFQYQQIGHIDSGKIYQQCRYAPPSELERAGIHNGNDHNNECDDCQNPLCLRRSLNEMVMTVTRFAR